MKRLAVFVSGSGSDMQSIIDAIERGEIAANIVQVVASKAGIYAIERAKAAGIPVKVFDKRDYSGTDAMFEDITLLMKEREVDLIVLAGYLSILSPAFVRAYARKIINIHPSLIPKHCGMGYYGMRVHESVLASGDTETGATVHYVDEGADTGEIIRQCTVPVLEGDTPQTLQARVLGAEHKLLPQVVAELVKE